MNNGYVLSLDKEMTLKQFADILGSMYGDKTYMPKVETASGFTLQDSPEDLTTSTFVVYCNVRTRLNTLSRIPGVLAIYEGADDPVSF